MPLFVATGGYYIMVGVCYVLGAAIYVYRIPERFFPGKFDFWGSSHNIWHLFVVAATVLHYLGSLECYHTRMNLECKEV